MPKTRIFFTSDVHSSERCFKKILNSVKYNVYKADIIFVNGDLTGKSVVPIIENGNGKFVAESGSVLGTDLVSESFDELYSNLRNVGCYPLRMTRNEFAEVSAKKEKVSELFKKLMLETIRDWLTRMEELSKKTGKEFLMMPGNDDINEIGSLISSSLIENPESKVVVLNGYPLVSLGYSNPTPWHTPRECSEEELESMIKKAAEPVNDLSNAIFNLHCPPFDSGLDTAPFLDENLTLKPTMGDVLRRPVGSTAVRKCIERYQPLLSMHGHIHECPGEVRIGRTISVNPGSEYQSGILRAYLIDVEGGKVTQTLRVEA
jgi:Icc-related predicted phosphoesterase